MKQLIGHTSPETAYVVDDYPYGFTLRTQIRYWIETKKNHGQRFVSQTLNPRTGKWNKPKASTYSEVLVLGLRDDNEYVSCHGLSYYDDAPAWESFKSKYQLDEFQLGVVDTAIKVKKQYAAKAAELPNASYTEVIKACIADDIATLKAAA